MGLMQALRRGYAKFDYVMEAHPWIVKPLLSGVTFVLGDAGAQRLQHRVTHKDDEPFRHDWGRTLRVGVIGTAFSGLAFTWFFGRVDKIPAIISAQRIRAWQQKVDRHTTDLAIYQKHALAAEAAQVEMKLVRTVAAKPQPLKSGSNPYIFSKLAVDELFSLVYIPCFLAVSAMMTVVLPNSPVDYLATWGALDMDTLRGAAKLAGEMVSKHAVNTIIADLWLWPAAQYINFRMVPRNMRMAYYLIVNIFWCLFLSYTTGGAH